MLTFLTGDHPRHLFVARRLAEAGVLDALVIERREAFRPLPPDGLTPELAALFTLHFDRRADAEARHFGTSARLPADLPDVPAFITDRDGLNGADVRRFLAAHPGRIVLSYGVHLLDPETLDAAGAAYRWNLHGGLSPWYRGNATHFWPSYFLEPQMTGFTVHETTPDVDHGSIIHQTGAVLVRGDGLHDLAARCVQTLVDELPKVVELADVDGVSGIAPRTSGRIWTSRDWRPEHLRVIYELHEDRIVDAVLDGRIAGREPRLSSVLPTSAG